MKNEEQITPYPDRKEGTLRYYNHETKGVLK
jgi:hypothetical protein